MNTDSIDIGEHAPAFLMVAADPDDECTFHFHCSPEWHLARLKDTPTAALIYSWGRRLSQNSEMFHASVIEVARYFGFSRWKVQRALKALVALGFAEIIIPREPFKPTVYRFISHNDWIKKHPGQCAVKETLPWTGETSDQLGRKLWSASGGRVKYQPYQLTALRKTGLDDEQIVIRFRQSLRCGLIAICHVCPIALFDYLYQPTFQIPIFCVGLLNKVSLDAFRPTRSSSSEANARDADFEDLRTCHSPDGCGGRKGQLADGFR